MGNSNQQQYIMDQLSKFVNGSMDIEKNGMLSRTPCDNDGDIENDIDELINSDKLYRIFANLSPSSWGRASTIRTENGADIHFDPNVDANYQSGPFSYSPITPAAELAHELARGTQIERNEPHGTQGSDIRRQSNRNAVDRANRAYRRMNMKPRWAY